MAERVGEWLSVLEALYPSADAESWDNVGLQVGDPDAVVDAVLVCLDVTPAVLEEAVSRGAALVIAHHPLLFRPLSAVTPATAAGRIALQAAASGVHVAAAHTNFDAAVDGTTAPVMALLGVRDALPLAPASSSSPTVKLVVFVPTPDTPAVLTAAFEAGAGTIGEYSECSFRVAGTGTFRPSASAAPALGDRGRRNDVAEDRVEVVVPRRRLSAVVDAVVAAHPYEEVALDVYPTISPPEGGSKGLGRVGELPEALPLRDIAERLRTALPSPHLRVAGDRSRLIRRVAACGGAGDSLIAAAAAAGADLFVTGDLRHHVTLDALTQGMCLIDAGHHATESAALPTLLERLRNAASERGLRARLLPSEVSTDPWRDSEEEQQR